MTTTARPTTTTTGSTTITTLAAPSNGAALVLTEEQREKLKELAGSRTAPALEVERAKILIGYADGASIMGLQRQLGAGRPMI